MVGVPVINIQSDSILLTNTSPTLPFDLGVAPNPRLCVLSPQGFSGAGKRVLPFRLLSAHPTYGATMAFTIYLAIVLTPFVPALLAFLTIQVVGFGHVSQNMIGPPYVRLWVNAIPDILLRLRGD